MTGVALGSGLWTFAVVCGLLVVGWATAAIQRGSWLRRWVGGVATRVGASRLVRLCGRGGPGRSRERLARGRAPEFEPRQGRLPVAAPTTAATHDLGEASTGASDGPDPSHSPGAGWAMVPSPAAADRGGRDGVLDHGSHQYGERAACGFSVVPPPTRQAGSQACGDLDGASPRPMSAHEVGMPGTDAVVVDAGSSGKHRSLERSTDEDPAPTQRLLPLAAALSVLGEGPSTGRYAAADVHASRERVAECLRR